MPPRPAEPLLFGKALGKMILLFEQRFYPNSYRKRTTNGWFGKANFCRNSPESSRKKLPVKTKRMIPRTKKRMQKTMKTTRMRTSSSSSSLPAHRPRIIAYLVHPPHRKSIIATMLLWLRESQSALRILYTR